MRGNDEKGNMRRKAMMSALSGLSDNMAKELNMPEADEMQKVSVLAEDKEGLQEGLDKAEEVLEDMPEMPEDDMSEDLMDEDMMNLEDMTEAELRAQIAMMQEELANR